MARRRRQKRPDPRQARMMPANPGWRWTTLPVWLALTGGFIAGWYVAALGALDAGDVWPGGWSYIVQLVVLIGFSLGLSRLMRWLTERWLARRRIKAAAAATQEARPHKRPQMPG